MKNLSVNDVLPDLPTLSRAFVSFAESLELLPLDELSQVVEDRNTQDILIAAANFKSAMAQVLQRRALLH